MKSQIEKPFFYSLLIIPAFLLLFACGQKAATETLNEEVDSTVIDDEVNVDDATLSKLKDYPSVKEKLNSYDDKARARFSTEFKRVDDLTLKTLDEQPDLIDVWNDVKYLKKTSANIKFLKKLKNLNEDEKLQDHLFKGEINKQGKAVGVHHISAMVKNGGRSDIVENSKQKSPDGTYYRVKVKVKNSKGKWIVKTSNKGYSTFFPDAWSKDRVLEEIAKAVTDPGVKKRGTFYVSKMSNGLELLFYKEANGRISSAFPRDWTGN